MYAFSTIKITKSMHATIMLVLEKNWSYLVPLKTHQLKKMKITIWNGIEMYNVFLLCSSSPILCSSVKFKLNSPRKS